MLELRRLLNEAYRELGEMGLNFTAVDQDEETTRRRISDAEAYLVYRGGALVGTVTLRERRPADDVPHLYLTQLAVRPGFRRLGLGSYLMDLAEREALARGLDRVRLDTAMPATHLLSFYEKRGYRAMREAQWRGKSYRSVIMEKRLPRIES